MNYVNYKIKKFLNDMDLMLKRNVVVIFFELNENFFGWFLIMVKYRFFYLDKF